MWPVTARGQAARLCVSGILLSVACAPDWETGEPSIALGGAASDAAGALNNAGLGGESARDGASNAGGTAGVNPATDSGGLAGETGSDSLVGQGGMAGNGATAGNTSGTEAGTAGREQDATAGRSGAGGALAHAGAAGVGPIAGAGGDAESGGTAGQSGAAWQGGAAGTAGVAWQGGAAGTAGAGGTSTSCSASDEFEDPSTSHCYKYVVTPALAWGAALTACQTWGGSLAELTTEAENTFVVGKLTGDAWLGASLATTATTYAWVSGEPWVFTAWAVNQPAQNGDCMEYSLARSGWNDFTCATAVAYLCERPVP